jgi:hypothetical protein
MDQAHGYTSSEPGLPEYLSDYEKSILWSYIGGLEDRFLRLHGLALSMRLLDIDNLPS